MPVENPRLRLNAWLEVEKIKEIRKSINRIEKYSDLSLRSVISKSEIILSLRKRSITITESKI
jgi:hypothetical protein